MIKYADKIRYTTKDGQKYLETSKENFIEKIKSEKSIYELTETSNQLLKLYFDIDDKEKKLENYDENKAQKIEEEGEYIISESLKTLCNIEPRISVAVSHSKNFKDWKYKKISCKYSVRYFVSNIIDTKENIKKYVKDINLYIKQSPEKYNFKEFDETIYSTNRLMRCVNSTKPNEERPLILKKGSLEDSIITNFYDEDAIELKYNDKSQIINKNVTECNEVKKENKSEYINNKEDTINKIKMIFEELLAYDIFTKYDNWLKLCFCIYNEFDGSSEGYNLLISLCEKLSNYNKDECFNQYNRHTKKRSKTESKILIGTLFKIYYSVFPEKKMKVVISDNNIKNQLMEKVINLNLDYDISQYFIYLYGENYVCLDVDQKIYYCFTKDNIWELSLKAEGGSKIKNMLSTNIYEDFMEVYNKYLKRAASNDVTEEDKEDYKKKAENMKRIFSKLKDNTPKNKILKEINEQIINTRFNEDMNKEKYMLPIKNNKMFNILTLEKTERTRQHKFDYVCNADYVEMTIEEENEIKGYFMSLFSNNEDTTKCLINILKTVFTGELKRYIYMLTGRGRNGKSLLFDILREIFQGAMDVISEKVITEKNNGKDAGATTEYEKLDKKRLGYVSELNEDDRLNTKNAKKISGGDPLDLRPLYKSNITINPTCNLFILTNEMPQFKIEQAIIDRMIVIPFTNRFEVDTSFKNKMLEKVDLIFSYIMKKGEICDIFNESEEMKEAKNSYKKDNINNDYLDEFIKTYFEKIDNNDKTYKVYRDTFKYDYFEWCKMNDFKIKDISYQKLSREMRNKFECDVYESNHKVYYLGLKRNDKKFGIKETLEINEKVVIKETPELKKANENKETFENKEAVEIKNIIENKETVEIKIN